MCVSNLKLKNVLTEVIFNAQKWWRMDGFASIETIICMCCLYTKAYLVRLLLSSFYHYYVLMKTCFDNLTCCKLFDSFGKACLNKHSINIFVSLNISQVLKLTPWKQMRQWFMKNLWYVDGVLSIRNITKLWSTDNTFKLVSVLFTTCQHKCTQSLLVPFSSCYVFPSFPKLKPVQIFLLGQGSD